MNSIMIHCKARLGIPLWIGLLLLAWTLNGSADSYRSAISDADFDGVRYSDVGSDASSSDRDSDDRDSDDRDSDDSDSDDNNGDGDPGTENIQPYTSAVLPTTTRIVLNAMRESIPARPPWIP